MSDNDRLAETIVVQCVNCGADVALEDNDGLWCGYCGIGYFCTTCYKKHEEGWHYVGSPIMLEDAELARIVKAGLGPDEPGWGYLSDDNWQKIVEHIAAQSARIHELEEQVSGHEERWAQEGKYR